MLQLTPGPSQSKYKGQQKRPTQQQAVPKIQQPLFPEVLEKIEQFTNKTFRKLITQQMRNKTWYRTA
jgi:hypothetical protein